MKKTIILLMMTLLFITGCGSRKLKSDKDLFDHLNRLFPGEEFEIVTKEEINISGDVGGCDDPGKGVSYKVKSKDTGLTFTVEDEYHFNSFTCEYLISDDYIDIAEEEFIKENSIYKVDTYHNCYRCFALIFKKEKYYSKEEMKSSIKTVINKAKETYPFKHESIRINTDITIGSEEDVSNIFNIDELDDSKIDSIVDSIYN